MFDPTLPDCGSPRVHASAALMPLNTQTNHLCANERMARLPCSCIETFLEVARSPAAGAAVVDACHAALLALVAPCHGQPADTAAILLRHMTPAVLGVGRAAAGDAGQAVKTSASGPGKAALAGRSRAVQLAKAVLECAALVQRSNAASTVTLGSFVLPRCCKPAVLAYSI